MKIIILTFSKANNYGANLQCYALSRILKEQGHHVELLDYQLPVAGYNLPGQIIAWVKDFKFTRFRNRYMPGFTKRYASARDLAADPPRADLYIVGSDQVWNPGITQRCSPTAYFFDFLPPGSRRIAYAASFGGSDWKFPELKEEITRLLRNFTAIGVREQSGVDICRKVFDAEAECVLDPTLLLGGDHYRRFLSSGRDRKKQLTIYKTVWSDHLTRPLAGISSELGLNPLLLNKRKNYDGFRTRWMTGVEEWLSEVSGAEMVITDSFHCMVFCILFRRPFFALPYTRELSERMVSLLDKLGIAERFVNDLDELADDKRLLRSAIDFDQVHSLLDRERESSLEFLLRSINSTQ